MKKLSALLIAFVVVCLFFCPHTIRGLDVSTASDLNFSDQLTLNAKSTYLVNLDTGRVIYEHNANERLSPASTTKIMTAALALSMVDNPKTTIVTLPDDLWVEFDGIDISHAGLLSNEQLTMEQLVHCMLLQSANEAASGVASFFGREEFIDLMNQKAASLGCINTHFVNPHGLFDPDHYISAKDLFLISEWALSVPGFSEIIEKVQYDIPETNRNYDKTIVTSIYMQDPTSRYYTSYLKGIKTGTLEQSGRCLVSTAQKNNMRFCLVLLGCPLEPSNIVWEDGNSVFTETRIIYDWVFNNAVLSEVISKDTIVTQIAVNYSPKKDALVLYSGDSLSSILRKNSEVKPEIRYELDLPEDIDAPITKGQKIGSAKVFSDDIYIGDISLVSLEEVEFSWLLMAIAKVGIALKSKVAVIIYLSVISIACLYFLYLFVIVRGAKKRHNR
ncbi:MAG: D-alanyl-D-alanine carboxypeptidase [Oscillospiraceae bacterium]|nr:D-alanyl-D-alanine carboxypeptidase [Oscillospiraceae bacterium]